MTMSWSEEYLEHPLWEQLHNTREHLIQSATEYERLDDPQVAALQELFSFIAGFEGNPHIAITRASLDKALQYLNEIHSRIPNIEQAFTGEPSFFSHLAATIRAWPLSGSVRLRGLSQQIKSLESEAIEFREALKQKVEDFETELNSKVTDTAEALEANTSEQQISFDERLQALETRANELDTELQRLREDGHTVESTIEQQKTRLDEALNRLDETFRAAEAKRASVWDEKLQNFEESHAQHTALMAEHEAQSRNILEAVGINSTATEYGAHAKDQQEAANRWRRLAVISFVLAGLIFVGATLYGMFGDAPPTQWWEAALQRLGAPLGFAGLGAFLANESRNHRKEEKKARSIELKLAALEPFISNLSKEDKEHIRKETAQGLFVQNQ